MDISSTNQLTQLPEFDGHLYAHLPDSGTDIVIYVTSSSFCSSDFEGCVFCRFDGVVVKGPRTGSIVHGTVKLIPGKMMEVIVDPNLDPPSAVLQAQLCAVTPS